MSPDESSKIRNFSVEKDPLNQEKCLRDDSKHFKGKRKVLVHRNSVLTEMLEISHIRTIHNICNAICILVAMCMGILYFSEPSKLRQDLDFISWNFAKLPQVILYDVLFHVLAVAFYEGFRQWVAVRSIIHPKFADPLFLFLYAGSYFLSLTVAGYYMLKVGFRPTFGFYVGSEQGRLFMKIHSFVRESAPRVLQHKPEKDGTQKHVLYPPRKHFLYFLFAPTLLYRDSYPRTEKTDWKKAIYHLSQVLQSIFVLYAVMMRYTELFQHVGIVPFSRKERAYVIAASIVPGSIAMFLTLYGVLHSWLNFLAEVFTFGDRLFYADWWNSTTYSQYYRKWNIFVHDWLYCYFYLEFQKLGCSTDVSRILVFAISCLYHDYMFSLSLGFFYPVFSVIYAIGGIGLIPISRGVRNQMWNIGLWFSIFLSVQAFAYHYTLEWYARRNCPKEVESYMDYFILRLWDPSCKISPPPRFFDQLLSILYYIRDLFT